VEGVRGAQEGEELAGAAEEAGGIFREEKGGLPKEEEAVRAKREGRGGGRKGGREGKSSFKGFETL
jgi:hypothetical protein